MKLNKFSILKNNLKPFVTSPYEFNSCSIAAIIMNEWNVVDGRPVI